MSFDPGLIEVAVKLGASVFGVLLLAGLARWLDLGGEMRIRDEDHAKRLAFEGQYGFKGLDAAVDLAGYSALVRDVANRHVLLTMVGNKIVSRQVRPPIEGRLDQKLLTLDLQEPDFETVTLNLGEAAQYWASGLRHIPNA